MDFLEAKHTAAREIALAFGVPPMVLGIPGDNTYANFQEANRCFFRQTVLPLASRIGNSFAQWLSPQFGRHPHCRGSRQDRRARRRSRRAVGARQ
jgi:phage portal protein BeeE